MPDPDRVRKVFSDSLFRDEELVGGEPPNGYVEAEGIVSRVGFHPQRLESHRAEVASMLNDLPEPFYPGSGNGWSFLNACQDRRGELWTGEHQTVEQLVLLGIGLGMVEYLLPRDMWKVLPGEMPYFVVKVPESAR